MPTARFQPSFGGGVIGPSLYGRIDTQKYDVGLKVGFNGFVHIHGGFSNRPGTIFVGEVPDHSKEHRLVPFSRSQTENLIMLFGDNVLKIIRDGSFVQSGGNDYSVATPYTSAQAVTLDYAQSIDVVFTVDQGVFPQKISRFADDDFRFEDLEVNPTVPAPTGLVSSVSHAGTTDYTYAVSSVIDGVEGFISDEFLVEDSRDLNVDGTAIAIGWTPVAGAEYNIYKKKNGLFGFIGFTLTNQFVDRNIDPNLELSPKENADIFDAQSKYPSVITIAQQRIIVGGSLEFPEDVDSSRIGFFEDFTRSRTIRADDRLSVTLNANGISEIRSFLQLRQLLIFTSLGEYSMESPGGGLSATNPVVTQYGYSGSSQYIKPLVVEDTALFVDNTGRQARDIRYSFEQDGYTGNDLTVFAYHYFEKDRIKGWAYSKNPFYIIWAYTESGRLLSLTYKREHEMWAWCDHDLSGGLVEQMAVIREGDYDSLYMIVRRVINGATVRYVERMDTRQFTEISDAYFVDCGIKYDGAQTNTITGLDHLEGETLVALADGDYVSDLVVNGGQVTLPRAASKVSIGLPYHSELETLPPSIELPEVGSSRGRPHKINRVFIQMEKTRGIKAGVDRNKLDEIVQTDVDLSVPIEDETKLEAIQVSPEWNREGTIVIRQDYPLPMTILGVSPEYTVGRSG